MDWSSRSSLLCCHGCGWFVPYPKSAARRLHDSGLARDSGQNRAKATRRRIGNKDCQIHLQRSVRNMRICLVLSAVLVLGGCGSSTRQQSEATAGGYRILVTSENSGDVTFVDGNSLEVTGK